ncbi:MAG: bifunctional chorismate mutase/prephenate dehydrogenase [Enterobacterales bacterium]|nr:bifunctional chorismate mutase/prephenate dehydrogenase [Enterobacterales bacterium]
MTEKHKIQQAEIEFAQVRKDIDAVDAKLVGLIAERQKLTAKVGQLKATLKLPLYVPSREKALIQQKRALGKSLSVSPDLVEDVLRRIMRDSYSNQNMTRAAAMQNKKLSQSRNILVIGGKGQLGSLFVALFKQAGYVVDVIEQDDWTKADGLFAKASMVMVAVPIRVTEEVIKKLTALPESCVLLDVTSVKQAPLSAMLESHKGPVVGLHPMFGPDIGHLAKQTIVVCHGRKAEQYQWLLEQLTIWGAELCEVDAKQHDHLMSIVQVLRHFSTVAYGYHLQQENIDLDKVLQLSSPIYRLELIMVGRLFAQDSTLYSDIIFSDPGNVAMVKRFLQRMMELLEMLESQDKVAFSSLFDQVSEWFADYAEQFLQESNLMLAKANDIKK